MAKAKPSEGFRRFVLSQHCGHGCQSKPFGRLKGFVLIHLCCHPGETKRMNEQMPFRNHKMVSIGSNAQLWVSEQTSSSLEEVLLGYDDSMDE